MDSLQQLIDRKASALPPETDAYRVADGYPWRQIFIDALADRLLVSLRDVSLPPRLRNMLEATGRPVYIKQLTQKNKQHPLHLCGPKAAPRFEIREQGIRYLMDMEAGYSQGIFLDQRDNRAEVRRRCRPDMAILNTFAYTGAFSVCAALAGATTTTLDLAQPCLNWCRDNMLLNGLDPSRHYFCKGDTLHWLSRFERQGRCFDAIILDPPTFSRDEKGHVWRVERDFGCLAAQAARCLTQGGWLLCSTNCRKLSSKSFSDLILSALPKARITGSPMPMDFDGEAYLKTFWVQPCP